MKHTPGPWSYLPGAQTRIGPQMIVRAKGSTVCEVFAQRGITEANARLIAAAPNMLAVLKLVVEYANTPQGKLDPRCPEFDRDLFDKFKLIWADVGAVIASAE